MADTSQGIPIYGTGDNNGKIEGYATGSIDAPTVTRINGSTYNDYVRPDGSMALPNAGPTKPMTAPVAGGTPAQQGTAPQVGNSPSLTPRPPVVTGTPPPTPGSTTTNLGDKYNTALSNVQASGAEAPQSQGEAMGAVPNYVPPPVPPANPIDSLLQADPAYQQLLADRTAYLSSQNQRQSLTQEYTSLMDSAGIPALNTELMNMKNVIDGTENDIRNEVTKAGGFATDSQVLALSSARNKVIIQNYNNLLETKNQATDNITTMMGLEEKDRAYADQQFNNTMQFDQQVMSYRDKMVSNAQDSLANTVKAIGYDGLLKTAQATGDPQAVSRIESTLGMPSGSLVQAATQATKDRATQDTMNSLDIQSKKASIANTYSEINSRNLQNSGGASSGVLAPYLKTSYDGTQYADLSSLTPSDKAKYAQIAQAAGVKPILDAGTAGKINAIADSKTNLQSIKDSLVSQNLLNNKQLPVAQGFTNSIKSFFGNKDIKSFAAWRTAVINNVQALAGGQGSGLRINQAEIDTALKNDLPVLTGTGADNLGSAQAKIDKLNSQLDVWSKQLLGGGNTAASYIPPIGSVIESSGKKYHVIDSQGNLQEI